MNRSASYAGVLLRKAREDAWMMAQSDSMVNCR